MKYLTFLLLFITACAPVPECPTCNCPPCPGMDYNTTEIVEEELPEIENYISVDVIDVGQGDATLIRYGNTEMLIDCGDNSKGSLIVDYLDDLGVEELDYLLVTHPDSDHIGGCDDVLEHVPTSVYIDNGQTKDTLTYREVMELIDTEQYIVADMSHQWAIGPGTIKVLQGNRDDSDTNQNSIVLRLDYGESSMLLTGDCDKDCEQELLTKNIEADILRVPHHGSKYGTTTRFLEKVNPTYAVISVGLNNRYGHPTTDTLDRITQRGIIIYRTDIGGDIHIKLGSESYEIS